MKKLKFGADAIFIIVYQSLLLLGLPFYFYFCTLSLKMFLVAFTLFWLSGLGITAGYHRYFSHRSYKAHPVIESILLFFGSLAIQGSALKWSFDHRLHHAHVDTDEDPYSIKKGFWYAHFLWLMDPDQKEIDEKVVSDLTRNKRVMFQHNHAILCMTLSNVFVFLLFGWLLNDFIGAFVIAVWTRLFFLHHFTWFINSLAHTWGDKPFCQEQTAVNNFLLSFVTFGEGYHNYHHTFASDYRNGVRWYHFDPSKWLIWTLSKCGLASSLRKIDAFTINKRMVTERKRLLLSRLANIWYVKREELEAKINELSERMLNTISEIKQQSAKSEIRRMKKALQHDWQQFCMLSKSILKLKYLDPINANAV